MESIWKKILRRALQLLDYAWRYFGTLSAMGLLLGVLGMGLYHALMRSDEVLGARYFSGIFNPASAQVPVGIGELLPPEHQSFSSPHIRFEYNRKGQLQRLVHLNELGAVSPIPGSKVAEQRMEYDKQGLLIARRNFNASGQPVADSSGVASRVFEYDAAGHLVARRLLGAQGQPVVPRMPGFAEERITYDAQGRPTDIRYLDGRGKPIVNARGESHVTFAYDDAKQEILRTNFVSGKPTDNASGVASEQVSRTADGRSVRTSWRNAAGEAVQNNDHEAHSELVDYMPSDRMHRTRRCGENGVMLDSARVWAEHLVRTTPAGSVVWECFNGSDGLPCMNHELGYAERVCEYGPDGKLESEFFWDANGNPSECSEKHYSAGHVLSLHADGSTEVRKESDK